MNEQLLQYLWQFQHYNSYSLFTTQGEPVQVIHPGAHNTQQGPDFLNAKIKIGNTTWAGSVEIHLKSSDWQKHQHQGDKNYQNVVLHVVYEHDSPEGALPVLELKERISFTMLGRYQELMGTGQFIPCERMIHEAPRITLEAMKQRVIAERLTRKAARIGEYLEQSRQHWEEAFWWLLARNFGIKTNAEAFEALAKSVPLHLLAKHKNQLHQLEALLLGQAGLLTGTFSDAYPVMLQKEYQFLQKKYRLQPIALPVHFLRMRPGNFPTVRLAQLAVLIHGSAHLFSKIIEEPVLSKVKSWFSVQANDFWHYHYKLTEASGFKQKKIGSFMIDNIIVNTLVPMLFSYGLAHQNQPLKDRALQWLEEIKAESNAITKGFQNLGLKNRSAYDSQALLELKNNYCNEKKCLQCSIGNSLLKRN